MSAPVDLRSDTVTRPTDDMRAAMASAVVGDDVFGEDPSARMLEERVADLLGKQAALFVPSGTMANQISLMLLARRGDEVIVGEGAHCAFYESGAGAVLAGVQFVTAGRGGLFRADDLDSVEKPVADWYPRTSVVAVENTHNRAGGKVFPQQDVDAIAAHARAKGFALHLDGARLWNASVATGRTPRELAAAFDTVSVCLSKGLGAPVGSLIVSTKERIAAARRFRKMLGGGMRQVGILAAAGLYALEHHRERLVEDHAHAKLLFEGIEAARSGCALAPETNILMIDMPHRRSADEFAKTAAEAGVRVSVFGPTRVRAVTHLDVNREGIVRAIKVLSGILTG